jgi:hypothetical protein
MFSEQLRPCIISMLDLIGTRSQAASGRASSAMVRMHQAAANKINHGLPLHSHGYVWNDSVLLLSYEVSQEKRPALLAELNEFKFWLEDQCNASFYAITVKGQAFPEDPFASSVFDGQISQQPRAVVLKTSSWAMANCFFIEKQLGYHKADWYMDSRVIEGVPLQEPIASEDVELLPKNEKRTVHMFHGRLKVDS